MNWFWEGKEISYVYYRAIACLVYFFLIITQQISKGPVGMNKSLLAFSKSQVAEHLIVKTS
jgi:hypothetical protein